MISEQQVAQYHEQGFLVVADVFSQPEIEAARTLIAEKVEASRSLTAHTDVYDLEPDHTAALPRVRRIKTPHTHMPYFRALTGTKALLEILQQLLGSEDVRLHGSKINMKSPAGGAPVEWHQDWAFYPHTNDDLLAVGVMLEDCTVENGAMLMIPGSHKGPVFDHHADGRFAGAMDPASVDLTKAAPCVGKAGSVSFHHVRTVHGSAQNMSSNPRTLLLYEFAAADAWPLVNFPADLATFDDRLVSGSSTTQPRLAPVPVRMPLPPAVFGGSIYETQQAAKKSFFSRKTAA